MKDKKGMELSLNFLIVLIISVTVLIGGVIFTYKFLAVVEAEEKTVNEETKAQIESLLMDGHQTAIPIDTITVKRGGNTVFGLGIYNSLADSNEKFRVAVQFKRAYDKLDKEMEGSNVPDATYINENWIFGETDSKHTVESNKYALVNLMVTVGGQMAYDTITQPGTYEFNVCVCPCREDDGCYESSDTFCIDNCEPNNDLLYGGHIMKLYVVVPS